MNIPDDISEIDTIRIKLCMEPRRPGTLVLHTVRLGADPFVLIRPEIDGNSVVMQIQTGGGVPQNILELAEVLEGIVEALREPPTQLDLPTLVEE